MGYRDGMAQAGTGSLADEDWDDLRFVLAVAEEGTVSAAARRLAVNHATVLRRIARFEDRHGMVFDKTPRGYSLAQGRQDLVSAARDVDRAVMGVSRILAGARLPLTIVRRHGIDMLETRELGIRFGGHVAVNAVSCRFEPGTLTGPSKQSRSCRKF